MTPRTTGTFSASYDSTSRAVSAGFCVFAFLIAFATQSVVLGCLCALIVPVAYAYSPRGYVIGEGALSVKRLAGTIRIPLERIREIRAATAADFRGSLRLWGNGGLFGYYGLFQTSKLGESTWYVTNRSHGVVVITDTKTVVLSPDDVAGFQAAIHASAPASGAAPGGPLPDSTGANGSGRVSVELAGAAIAIVVLGVVAFAIGYSPGPPTYTLTPDLLTIHDRFYPVTLRASSVDVEHIRVIDFSVDGDWRPTARTNGFANGHYHSGWFRVASGKTVRMYQASGTRMVLLPPKGDNAAVLLETREPEAFIDELWRKQSEVCAGFP